jgi:hypothetical protein
VLAPVYRADADEMLSFKCLYRTACSWFVDPKRKTDFVRGPAVVHLQIAEYPPLDQDAVRLIKERWVGLSRSASDLRWLDSAPGRGLSLQIRRYPVQVE